MNVLLLILFMMIVTYVPRMVPSLVCDKLRFGKKFKKFLELIPYAAMTALVFPGIISVSVWAHSASLSNPQTLQFLSYLSSYV